MTSYQNYNPEMPNQSNTAETDGRIRSSPRYVYDKYCGRDGWNFDAAEGAHLLLMRKERWSLHFV